MGSLAIFGGTFDPVHIGHLRSAIEVRELLACDELRFIPCHQPPHRGEPSASSAQRLRMLELAIAGEPGFAVDAREIEREGPSYTIDTLAGLRAEFGCERALHVIIGVDAFAALNSWQRWRELFDFANFVVLQRPDSALPETGVVAAALRERRVEPAVVREHRCGAIAVVQQTQLPISATAIRALIRAGRSPRFLLPDAVWQFIRDTGLYA